MSVIGKNLLVLTTAAVVLFASNARAGTPAGFVSEVNVWPGGEVSVVFRDDVLLCAAAANRKVAHTQHSNISIDAAKMMLSILTAAQIANRQVVLTTADGTGECKLLHVRML